MSVFCNQHFCSLSQYRQLAIVCKCPVTSKLFNLYKGKQVFHHYINVKTIQNLEKGHPIIWSFFGGRPWRKFSEFFNSSFKWRKTKLCAICRCSTNKPYSWHELTRFEFNQFVLKNDRNFSLSVLLTVNIKDRSKKWMSNLYEL